VNRFLVLTAAVTAIALVAVGCGSDDDNGTTDSTASLTKAEFLEQGNAICRAGNKAIDGEFEKFAEEHNLSENKPPTDAQFEEAAEEFLVPAIARQVEEVRDLGLPEGEEDTVDEFLENAEAEVEKIEDDPSALNEDAFVAVNKEARTIGLVACSEG
jgi:hypothetical protein